MLRIAEKSIHPDVDNIPEDLKPLEDALLSISGSTRFDDKLKIYCEFRELNKTNESLTSGILYHYGKSRLEFLYNHFGIKGCRSVGYRTAELNKRIQDETHSDELRSAVYETFFPFKRYSLKDIKYILTDLYKRLGIKKTAKASDISDFFNVQQVNLYDPTTKKRTAGYELISIK